MQPGQALVTFVRADQQWVTANYRETQISRLHVGQKVRLKVDALQSQPFEGTVTAISEATGARYSAVPTDNSTGNFVKVQQRIPIRIDFMATNTPESLLKLRAGMNVEVDAQLLGRSLHAFGLGTAVEKRVLVLDSGNGCTI